MDAWCLTSLQQRLVKRCGRLVKHAVLLDAAGQEPPDATPVRNDAPADLGATRVRRLRRVDCRKEAPGNGNRGERWPRKCFGTEGQSMGYQRELGWQGR